MNYTAVGMVYTALQTALLGTIRYWLYQDNLRVPVKRMYVFLFAFCLGGTGIWAVTGGIPGVPFSYFRLFLASSMFILSCFIIKEPFSKHAYTYSFIMVYDSVPELTATFVQSRLMKGDRGVLFSVTAAVILGVTFVPAVKYLRRMILRLSVPGNDRLRGFLSVISFSFVFMNLLFTYPLRGDPTVKDLLSRYLMLVGIGALYAATTRAVETMSEAALAKAELNNAKKQVAMQGAIILASLPGWTRCAVCGTICAITGRQLRRL